MPLSSKQRARLETLAKERGIDVAQLVARAEEQIADKPTSRAAEPTAAKPAPPAGATSSSGAVEEAKLFQYHLPFVTVNEVRERWLKLDPWSVEDGGDDNAAAFAAKQVPSKPPEGF